MEPTTAEDYRCEHCPKHFSAKKNLNQHKRQVHGGEKQHRCGICSKTFSRKINKDLHVRTCARNVSIGSEIQNKPYQTITNLEFSTVKKSSAFRGAFADWIIYYPKEYYLINPITLIKSSSAAMKDIILQHNASQTKRLKYTMAIHIVFEKAADPEVKTDPPVVLRTDPRIVDQCTDIDKALAITADDLLELIEEFEGVGSGWRIDRLVQLDTGLYSF